jgi:hypothetical protein
VRFAFQLRENICGNGTLANASTAVKINYLQVHAPIHSIFPITILYITTKLFSSIEKNQHHVRIHDADFSF